MIAREFHLRDDFAPVDYATWKRAAEADLKGVPFAKKLVGHTHEGIDLQPIYSEENAPTVGDPGGFPGLPPFIRGTKPLGNTLTGWDIRQHHTWPDPAGANSHILDDLRHGVTSIQLRFDSASSFGFDADDPRAAGLCGRDGVMLYCTGDLDRALAEVPLDKPVVFLDTGGAYLPAAALVVATAASRDITSLQLQGAFNADPLGALLRDGRLTVPIETALAHLADMAAWTAQHAPGMRAVEVCTSPYHHAGAATTQDLAFMMATGIEYLRAMTASGLNIQVAAKQILFSDSLDCHFFRAIAKIRAARLLWSRVVALCGGHDDAQRMLLRVRISRRVMTVRDPWINILRNTVAAFAGALGGADAVTTMPFDSASDWSDQFGRQNARNVQLLLREEAYLHHAVDPTGGSWFLETLTRQLAERAWALLQEIEAQGGLIQAVRNGWVQKTIDAVAKVREKNIATRLEPITGISEHADVAETKIRRPAPDVDALSSAARSRLAAWRCDHPCQDLLTELAELALSKTRAAGQLTAAAIRAAEAGATIGQLAQSLAGNGREPAQMAPLAVHPYDLAFEDLRDACDAYLARHGERPRVFLAGIGAVRDQMARINYARNFFEAGGLAAVSEDGPADVAMAVQRFSRSGTRSAVICSTDPLYDIHVEQLAPRLRAAGARTIILAGHPGAHEARYRAAGVDRFIFVKCDVLETLRSLLREEGVLP